MAIIDWIKSFFTSGKAKTVEQDVEVVVVDVEKTVADVEKTVEDANAPVVTAQADPHGHSGPRDKTKKTHNGPETIHYGHGNTNNNKVR